MAAKVVMVAVPTVLGIASIRVYTVREVPADELVPRQQLNIYTPLPQSTQAQFVPEVPGVIQSGLTSARETILPFVQATKGACSSMKRGTINLYYSAEDAFYYLKDPPPEFLPRFGTITMAGLLGMFLARKGSRFKRVAVPVGLMSAGASVCYPAQTVAVLKVTGKKVYAAGHWSSTAVSALLTPKPKEPVTKETAASQAQAAAVPNPESAEVEEAATADGSTQSSVIPEVEVESADQQEPAGAVISEESLVTLTEIPHEQTPTDTTTDPVVHSVPAETNNTSTSDEIPAPVEGEEPSDIKQAAEDVSTNASPAEITPRLEPEGVEATPVEAVLVEDAPVEATPMEATPAKAAPVEDAPTEATLVEDAPVEAALVEATPVEDAPVEAAPVEATPVEDAPVEATPVEDAPVEATPVTPTHCAEVESAPLSEEPSPEVSSEPSVPVVESTEPQPDPTQAAAVEETTPTFTPPTPELPAAENSKDGSGFTPDPALMDFGQSNPEDEDLYSTRS